MTPTIPSWPDIDITNVFYTLWGWFVAVWKWSGSSYIVFANERISFRNIIAAGLVVAMMIRAFFPLHEWQSDVDESIAFTQDRFDRYD